MRGLRGSTRFTFLLGTLLVLGAAPARAQLWVATIPEEQTAVEHAELAYALGDGAAATWLALRVRRGPVAVVAALDEGARVAASPDAWFSALEDTASPSVVPPAGSSDCGSLSSYVRIRWPRSRSAAAAQLSLESPSDVVAALEAEGLTAPSQLPEPGSYVVWIWPDSGSEFTTQTFRVDGGARALPLAAGWTFPISVTTLSNGPTWFESELDKTTLPVTFVAGTRPSTDYREQLAAFLDEKQAPLLEARANGLLFDWSIYGDVVSVAPLVRSYAEQAGGELADLDAQACREQLAALQQAGAPPASACGEAVDAGLALGLLEPGRATLQRFQLSSRDGVEPAALQSGGQPSAPLLRATRFDGSACEDESSPPLVFEPDPPVTAGEPPRGGGTVVVEETVVIEREPVEVSCGGNPEPVEQYDDSYYEDDSIDCSSDTSSSSDSSEDCSSDTSSSSDSSEDCSSDTSSSSDEDCSSDSSSSSEAGGEVDCASDSSSSSSDGCSGDSSSGETSGYDGDTCTGQAAPRAESSSTQAALSAPAAGRPRRLRSQRLKASAWTLGLAALVLPIRRRKRRPSAAG